MVITCPSCLTKFAVDNQLVAQVDQARFHCCRCGEYFTLPSSAQLQEGSASRASESASSPSSDWTPCLDIPDSELLNKRDSYEAEQLSLLSVEPESLSITPDSSTKKPLAPNSTTESKTLQVIPTTATFGNGGVDRVDIDQNTLHPLVTADWPAETQPSAAQDYAHIVTPVEPSARAFPTDDQQPNWKRGRADIGNGRPEFSQKLLQRESHGAHKRAQKQQRWASQLDGVSASQKQPAWRLFAQIASRNSSVLTCISLPIGLLLFIYFGTHAGSQQLPHIVSKMFSLTTNELPRVPPAGLTLSDVKTKILTLDSGERVLQVEANLLNATSKHYRNVVLQGLLFDEYNQMVSSVQAASVNALGDAQLQALTPESIKSLQTQKAESLTEDEQIAPNALRPVRLVFSQLNGREKWLSAIVYSVKPA